ncbi:MAG: uncharacterized protein A8A55_1190 [Amphiamblys sp. WSBS2006]|nr:MAG: uncharacterized protein A8A55_1190 [Amphiamblys sp. WSBS2006]
MEQLRKYLRQEVDKSDQNVAMFAESMETVGTLGKMYQSFADTVAASQQGIKKFNEKTRKERFLVYGSFLLFLLSVLFVLYRRVLYVFFIPLKHVFSLIY